jgi:hypothetical protein
MQTSAVFKINRDKKAASGTARPSVATADSSFSVADAAACHARQQDYGRRQVRNRAACDQRNCGASACSGLKRGSKPCSNASSKAVLAVSSFRYDVKGRIRAPMNIWQIGFIVRAAVSALVVAFLLGYAAHHDWGLSSATIRTDALLTALLLGILLAIDMFGRKLRRPKR